MENLSNNDQKEKKYVVAISMDKESHDMLVAFAAKENRSKGNAALILVKNSLLLLENLYSNERYIQSEIIRNKLTERLDDLVKLGNNNH